MAKWDKPIGIPFAENGDRANIPDTSEDGNVNNTTGFGSKYEIDPAVGGLWLYRQTMNSLFYNMFSSIKEIQTKVPISVNGTTPDASGNIPIIIPEPDGAGITVIDDNSPDITSFNQITKDGVYYIYKQLSDGPQQNGEAITYNYINLLVINVKVARHSFDVCMQATSFGLYRTAPLPGNIGSMPMIRAYDRNSLQWEPWYSRHGIPFIDNSIAISPFFDDMQDITFPVIAKDAAFPSGYNMFMYSASKAQVRAQLGITNGGGSVEAWSTYTAPTYSTSQGIQTYTNLSYCLFTKKINNQNYNMIKLNCILSFNPKVTKINDMILRIPLPQNIIIYDASTDLKNNVLAYIKYSCNAAAVSASSGEFPFQLGGNVLVKTTSGGGRDCVDICISTAVSLVRNVPFEFLVEIEAFVRR